ncbi:acyl carrier protein [Gorillibacterium sp. CAU 1737]|uniref:acyl carrier protein n=1 Tax=Gorillibacterium sp. CAU 1737 TaxID=3140362 RepID=UPI00326108F3
MIFEWLKQMIHDMGITEEMDLTTTFEELQMDSTELIDLSTAISKEYRIFIPDKELTDFSIGQVIERIELNRSLEQKVQ